MQRIELLPGLFHGAADLQFHEDGSVQPWRLKLQDLDLYHHTPESSYVNMARMPSGVRLVFRCETRRLRLVAEPLDGLHYYDYDLVCDGKLIADRTLEPIRKLEPDHTQAPLDLGARAVGAWSASLAKAYSEPSNLPDHVVEFDSLPAGSHVYELWLSNVGPQKIRSLEVDAGAVVSMLHDSRPRWLTYGSSITHGMGVDGTQYPGLPFGSGSAHGPSRTWPATAARLADVNLLSLGVGGQCHMDQVVARQIRDTEADAISLKLGINIHNMGSMGVRTFGQAAIGFILTVRDGHPRTPLLIISPIAGAFREAETHSANPFERSGARDPRYPTLAQMRGELKRIVDMLRRRGDENIYYISGLELMSDGELRQDALDLLHPSGDGYELMGRRFAQLAFGPSGKLLPGRAPQSKL